MSEGKIMSLYDDMYELDNFFKMLAGKNRNAVDTYSSKELRDLRKAWNNVSNSHNAHERREMEWEPVINACRTIVHSFSPEAP